MITQTNPGSGATGGNNPAASAASGAGAITTSAFTKALSRAFTLTRQMIDDRVILPVNGVVRNRATLVAEDLGGIYLLEEEGYFVLRTVQTNIPSYGNGSILSMEDSGTIADTDTAAADTDGEPTEATDGIEILGEPYNYNYSFRVPDDIAGEIPDMSDDITTYTSDRDRDDAAGLDPTLKTPVRAYLNRLCLVYGKGRAGLYVTTERRIINSGGFGATMTVTLSLVAYLDDNTAADALATATAAQSALTSVVAAVRSAPYLFSDTSEEAVQWRQEQLSAENAGIYYADDSGALQRVASSLGGIKRYTWNEIPEGLATFSGLVVRNPDTALLLTPDDTNTTLVRWRVTRRDVVVDFDDRDDSGIFSDTVQRQLDSLKDNPTLVSHYTGKSTEPIGEVYSPLVFSQLPTDIEESMNASAMVYISAGETMFAIAAYDLGTSRWRLVGKR